MATVPSDFASRLDRAFNGRLRVRWSNAKHEYHVEQRVSRALASFPVTTHDDDSIRLRDGYLYLLSIRPGTQMPCPKCRADLPVPIREIREVTCVVCKLKGQAHRITAGYFPLDDALIDYLKRLDPERSASRTVRNAVDAHNAKILEGQRQAVLERSLGRLDDDFSRIAGIPSLGYTGKEFTG
jgi:hypothetical protein